MTKDPSFLFYPEAFIMGTIGMSSAEKGDYITLLCIQHQQGGLIPKSTFESIVGVSNFIRSKFIETEEGWFNIRLMKEIEKRQVKSTNMSENAKIRWLRYKENAKAMQLHSKSNATAMQPKDKDINININKKLRSKIEIEDKDKRGEFQERGESDRKSPVKAISSTKQFIDWYCQEYQSRFGEKYIMSGAKEGSIIKGLLTSISLEDLQDKTIKFFESTDDFILRAGFTIGVFKSQINKLHPVRQAFSQLPEKTRKNIAAYQSIAKKEGWND